MCNKNDQWHTNTLTHASFYLPLLLPNVYVISWLSTFQRPRGAYLLNSVCELLCWLSMRPPTQRHPEFRYHYLYDKKEGASLRILQNKSKLPQGMGWIGIGTSFCLFCLQCLLSNPSITWHKLRRCFKTILLKFLRWPTKGKKNKRGPQTILGILKP